MEHTVLPARKASSITSSPSSVEKSRSKRFSLRRYFRASRKLDTRALSIKKLTLLGFTLVTLPLVSALIYSALQINQLSSTGAQAIFSVADLTNINQQLNEGRIKLERYASQYIVLKDTELKSSYTAQHQGLISLLDQHLSQHADTHITGLSTRFRQRLMFIHDQINQQAINEYTLEVLQRHFVVLAQLSEQIIAHSSELIRLQADDIKARADQVSRTMLISLLIIPVTLIIAGFFTYVITAPLKLLIGKIQSLEQGDFDKAIHVKSSPEIREIAEALEMMRLRLHALELQKSSFIRHISHELKTPLAAIREGTELIYDNSVGPLNDEQQEICVIIRDSVNRLQRHIEDLLDFNIVLDSTSLQDSEKVVLLPLLQSVIDDHKLDIKRKHLTINNKLQHVTLNSNVKQLRVILDNIIANAINYSNDSDSINIDGTLEHEQLTLRIADQGPGIANELKEKVFDAFFQGPAPIDNQVKGSGLGLTIVKELLMRLNGTIQILDVADYHLPALSGEQQAHTTGTIVEITLPRVAKNDE